PSSTKRPPRRREFDGASPPRRRPFISPLPTLNRFAAMMRIRVAAGSLVVLMLAVIVPLALATGGSAQTLHCGAGGAGGSGGAGGYGTWTGAHGGNGVAPQADQSANGNGSPAMTCW